MKIGLLWLVAIGTVLAGGCKTSERTAPAPEKGAASLEHKTVEFLERSDLTLRARIAEWNREGWSVLSISTPVTQTNGAVLRRAELRRNLPDSAEAPMELKTIEFVQRSMSDIREHMTEWNREGWAVLRISKPFPQDDGTSVVQAELRRRPPQER